MLSLSDFSLSCNSLDVEHEILVKEAVGHVLMLAVPISQVARALLCMTTNELSSTLLNIELSLTYFLDYMSYGNVNYSQLILALRIVPALDL
jgi:hypothetical protein